MKGTQRILQGISAGLLMVLAGSSAAWAQDPIHKAGRGVVNVLTAWIELPKQIQLGSQEDNPIKGIGVGIARGIGLAAVRLGIGAYEAVTFPLPYPKDFASPYEQLELTDYAWE